MYRQHRISCDLTENKIEQLRNNLGNKVEVIKLCPDPLDLRHIVIFYDNQVEKGVILDCISATDKIFDITIPMYTKTEIESAEWFVIRSKSAKVEIEPTWRKNFELSEFYEEGRKAEHRKVKDYNFYVKRPVKHNNFQCFFSSYDLLPFHLFCCKKAKEYLSEVFPELVFFHTIHNKKNKILDDLFYVDTKIQIEDKYINHEDETQFICRTCGARTYEVPEPLNIMKRGVPVNCDVFKTDAIYSLGGNLQCSLICVSQNFRNLLINEKMDRGLVFIPIQLDKGVRTFF